MKVAILGTKGIPNNYGGYEQFAEYLSKALVAKGHSVTVYNPSFHPYQASSFDGVSIIHKYSPEKLIGGSANIVYDFLCLRDALKRDFDIIYEAGYHSVALAYRILGVRNLKRPVVVTNMDGLEYNRSKWSPSTQRIIRWLERVAVADSPHMISDNVGIQEYYKTNFGKDSFFLPYGADPVESTKEEFLGKYGLKAQGYLILVARFEPENNLEMVLDGYVASGIKEPFLVVGKHENPFGNYLKKKYASHNIQFPGGIYNKGELDALRHFSLAYFHGHSVGGTNPSLLEAMACETFIIAHDNPFNRYVLYDSALYFGSAAQVEESLKQVRQLRGQLGHEFIRQNRDRIKTQYNWDMIVQQHEELFVRLISTGK